MVRFKTYIPLILLAVVWFSGASGTTAVAAVAPQISSLGQIRDGFIAPTRLDVDSQGNLYVVDARKQAVSKFDKYGNQSKGIHLFDAIPASGGGLAVTDDGALLFVAESKSVAVIDGVSGAMLGYLGGQDRFDYVYDIDIDANGYVFVADAGRVMVDVFRPTQSGVVPYVYEYQFGSMGVDSGQMMGVCAMGINAAAGEVYIADSTMYKPEGSSSITSYPKVQVYDLAGSLKEVGTSDFILLGSKSFGAKETVFFGGMTFDSQGRGYFLDSFNGRVNVLNLEGSDPLKMYLSSYTTMGFAQGQLADPRDVTFDPLTNRLFVLCSDGRVEIFGIDGATSPVSVNNSPSIPELSTPIAGSETNSATPQLAWLASTDADGDDIEYRVQIGLKGGTATTYEGITEIVFDVSETLEENGFYSWTVQASDGEDDSDWASSQTFYVNAEEEAPVAPVLASPAAAAVVDGNTTLAWQASSDPDPFDVINYILQVSTDSGFSTIVFEEVLDSTSVLLGDCTGYPALDDAKTYFWRVKAVDSTGLESDPSEGLSFAFDTTVLKVSADVSGARVYLAGNLGFAGQYVGEAPVELRDFPAGMCSVVLEADGYEPFVAQAKVVALSGAEVTAVMVPVIAPDGLKVQGNLSADSKKIRVGADAAPFYVDFNNDGAIDLLIGNDAGNIDLYLGAASDVYDFTEVGSLSLSALVPGAVPSVVDWNDDYRKDLLVGGADGTLTLFLNVGTEKSPEFADGTPLMVGGGVLDVGSMASPAVVDFDADGNKDLVIGSADGTLVYYHNIGEASLPVLEYSGKLVEMPEAAATVPFFVDWDGNGSRDLMVSAGGQLYSFLRQEDGSFAAGQALQVDRLDASDVAHFFACDVDGKKGKDLLVGTVSGEIIRVMSNGKSNDKK